MVSITIDEIKFYIIMSYFCGFRFKKCLNKNENYVYLIRIKNCLSNKMIKNEIQLKKVVQNCQKYTVWKLKWKKSN